MQGRFYYRDLHFSYGAKTIVECVFSKDSAMSIVDCICRRYQKNYQLLDVQTNNKIDALLNLPINFHHFNVTYSSYCHTLQFKILSCGGGSNILNDENRALERTKIILNYAKLVQAYLQWSRAIIIDCRLLMAYGPANESEKFQRDKKAMVQASNILGFHYYPLLCNVPMAFTEIMGQLYISCKIKSDQEIEKNKLIIHLRYYLNLKSYLRIFSDSQIQYLFSFWVYLNSKAEHLRYVFLFCTMTTIISKIFGCQMIMGCHFGKDRTSIVEAGIAILIPLIMYRLEKGLGLYNLVNSKGILNWEILNDEEREIINSMIDENFLNLLNQYSVGISTNFTPYIWTNGFFSQVPRIKNYKAPISITQLQVNEVKLALGF